MHHTETWRPTWWKEEAHGSAWARIREAMHRDWTQTKQDMHVRTGHELNQDAGDTVKQMAGKKPLPANDRPNPPEVIGRFEDAELPLSYGYGARQQFGTSHPLWNDDLETRLRSDWEAGKVEGRRGWDDVRDLVRRGYEYQVH